MKRALLLSGGVSQQLDHRWYANDIAAYYRLLLETYKYAPTDVQVCIGAGGARPVLGGDLVRVKPAKREPVREALGWLAELGEGDQAFLLVTDHGGPEGISLWGKEQFLAPQELAQVLGSSAATKVIVLGQCYSGCFGALPLGRAVVCAASDELSYPAPSRNYSEFLYQFAGALRGHYPDDLPLEGQSNPPVRHAPMSIGATFRYAQAHDHWITGTKSVDEIPRMFDPEGIADHLTL